MNEVKRTIGTWDVVTRNGKNYQRYRCSYGGTKKEFTGRTKKEVQAKILSYEKNPLTRKQEETLKMPFHEYMYECATYFSYIKREEKEGPNRMQMEVINHVKNSKLGKCQLGCVSSSLITSYIMEMRDKRYACKTINSDLGFIKRCLKRAHEQGIISKNPAAEVTNLQEKEAIKKTRKVSSLQISDMNKLIKEAKRINTIECKINGEVGTRVYGVNADIICFLLYSGLRIGECLALTWNDIIYKDGEMDHLSISHSLKEEKDDEGKTILVRGTTKTASSVRVIFINEMIREILLKQKELYPNAKGEDFVFQTEEGTPIMYRNVTRTLRSMLTRAKCSNTNASVHALRHTFGSYLISQGASVYEVSKLLGHSNTRVTENAYLELLDTSNKKASSLINNLKSI